MSKRKAPVATQEPGEKRADNKPTADDIAGMSVAEAMSVGGPGSPLVAAVRRRIAETGR